MPVRGTLVGSESLFRKLGKIRDAAKGRMIENALTSGGLLIQNRAKQLAPYRTGTLRRSIHIGGHEDLAPDYQAGGDAQAGSVSSPDVGSTSASIYIGTNLEYARMQEYGGTIVPVRAARLAWRNADGDFVTASSVTIPASPYMRPAFDEQGGAAKREAVEAMRSLIRRAVR